MNVYELPEEHEYKDLVVCALVGLAHLRNTPVDKKIRLGGWDFPGTIKELPTSFSVNDWDGIVISVSKKNVSSFTVIISDVPVLEVDDSWHATETSTWSGGFNIHNYQQFMELEETLQLVWYKVITYLAPIGRESEDQMRKAQESYTEKVQSVLKSFGQKNMWRGRK